MVDIDTLALAVTHQILGVDHVAPYVQRKARIQCIIVDALRAFASASPPAPDREAIANAIINSMPILRGLNAALDAIMILLNPPARDDVISYYYVRNGYIFKRPVRTDAGVTMGFPVCLVCDGVDAEQVCAILNRGEPATE